MIYKVVVDLNMTYKVVVNYDRGNERVAYKGLGKIVGAISVRTILHTKPKNSTSSSKTTTDLEYSALLAHLNSMPVQMPAKRTYTRKQEQVNLSEDLLKENGEAAW